MGRETAGYLFKEGRFFFKMAQNSGRKNRNNTFFLPIIQEKTMMGKKKQREQKRQGNFFKRAVFF